MLSRRLRPQAKENFGLPCLPISPLFHLSTATSFCNYSACATEVAFAKRSAAFSRAVRLRGQEIARPRRLYGVNSQNPALAIE